MLTLIIAVAGVLAGIWCFARPHRLGGTKATVEPGDLVAPISVIVPARNEAGTLPELLDSLARSTVRPAEIIVVDDGSADGTAEVARAHGARVIEAPPLPPGWVGKNWACQQGAGASDEPYLLFLDADTRVAPAALAALLSTQNLHGGLVSVQPFHRPLRRYEELSAIFNVVSMFGTGAFAARASVLQRMAFGPCLLIARADYDRIGGHAAVRDEVVEDIALAERCAASGLPVTCRLGASLVSFRMYPDGPRSLVQGWTKNIALGAGRAPVLPTVLAVAWVAALAAVAVATVGGTIGWVTGGRPPLAAAAGWFVMAAHLRWVLGRIGSFRPSTAALYPVPLVCFLLVFVRSTIILRRRSTALWRGREVSLHVADGRPGTDDR